MTRACMSGVKKPSSVANGSAWRQVKEMTIRTPDVLRKRGPHEAALWKASGCYGKLVQRTPDCRSMARAKYLSERRFRNVHAEILIFGVFPKDRHGLPSRWRTCSRKRHQDHVRFCTRLVDRFGRVIGSLFLPLCLLVHDLILGRECSLPTPTTSLLSPPRVGPVGIAGARAINSYHSRS
jgi:hypothetical protein